MEALFIPPPEAGRIEALLSPITWCCSLQHRVNKQCLECAVSLPAPGRSAAAPCSLLLPTDGAWRGRSSAAQHGALRDTSHLLRKAKSDLYNHSALLIAPSRKWPENFKASSPPPGFFFGWAAYLCDHCFQKHVQLPVGNYRERWRWRRDDGGKESTVIRNPTVTYVHSSLFSARRLQNFQKRCFTFEKFLHFKHHSALKWKADALKVAQVRQQQHKSFLNTASPNPTFPRNLEPQLAAICTAPAILLALQLLSTGKIHSRKTFPLMKFSNRQWSMMGSINSQQRLH